MGIRILLSALLALLPATPVMAQSAQEVLRQAEASMVVTGHVDIEADGTVSAHHINNRGKLPDFVVALVDGAAPGWRFEPLLVDGEPVPARARMNLRVVARPVGDQYQVSIANGSFGEYSDTATDQVTRREDGMRAPRYPEDMLRSGVAGTVYLVLKVGRDGSVEDVVAERVNLRAYAREREMERWRRAFAQRSVYTAREWKFNPPTTGPRADAGFWVIRVPVEFEIDGNAVTAGTWETYVPGPLQPAPDWLKDATRSPASDAMTAGGVQMVGNERRLLTPLGG